MTTTTEGLRVTSADGTAIAVSVIGSGPAVVLVDGAMCYRASGPAGPLAKALADSFTVYTYDRRARGESGDTKPYSTNAEVQDLTAVIKLAGGSADVYAISSGVVLALDTAATGAGIRRLALYEAPLVTAGSKGTADHAGIVQQLESLVQQDKRADAVRLFMRIVGVPGFVISLMRFLPAWKRLTGVAHTLPYDFRFLQGLRDGTKLPAQRWSSVTAPALVMAGGKSPQPMQAANRELSDVLPSSQYRMIPGQTHMLKPGAIAPVLKEYFS
jgi:pimeloyl-ACP methyl ester carboxylesterase